MRRVYCAVAGLVIAVGLAISFMGSAEAAPIGPAAVASQSVGPLATPVHCRVYRHCHRRCWWRNGRRHCRSFCHRC
jgi:hypothetical protein